MLTREIDGVVYQIVEPKICESCGQTFFRGEREIDCARCVARANRPEEPIPSAEDDQRAAHGQRLQRVRSLGMRSAEVHAAQLEKRRSTRAPTAAERYRAARAALPSRERTASAKRAM